MKNMIEVRNISKWYGPVAAVDDVSFDVSRGEVVGFIGPNGAGKTTTMKVLTTYTRPTAGKASVAGHDVVENPLEVRRRIGYLPEHNPLYHDMKVREYLAYMARLRQITKSDIATSVAKVVGSCALETVYEREIRELSKGYRQRVGLAQAMIHDPEVLILDEPTSGLDPNQIVEVRNLIMEIGKERTVILSTHTLSEVARTCGRMLVIYRGRLKAEGSLAELRRISGLHDAATLVFEDGADDRTETLSSVPGVMNARRVLENEYELVIGSEAGVEKDLFTLTAKNGWNVKSFEHKPTTLEDVFNALTIGEKRETEAVK